MIRSPAALEPVLASIAGARTVAIDTEFHSERHYFPRLMLIQLRVDDGPAHLIDALAGLDIHPLGEALSHVPLLVHGGVMDVRILHREAGLQPLSVFDTQIAAGFVGDGFPVRLQELVRRHLDIHLPKNETLSDWSRRPLSNEQLQYAADDVLLLGPLEAVLRERLEHYGNTAVAEQCSAEHVARALAPIEDLDAWRTVQGAHLLDDPERATLQALAAWRELTARERDVGRPSVMTDALLLDLSRRQPATPEAMRANRRMPSQVWKRDAEAVLACIAGAVGAPAPPPLAAGARARRDLLQAAARVAELQHGVAAELLLNEEVLAGLAAGTPLEGWRAAAAGDEFNGFLTRSIGIFLPGEWGAKDNS